MKSKKKLKEDEIDEVIHLFRNKGLKPSEISALTGRSIKTVYRWLKDYTSPEKRKDTKVNW